VTDTSQFDAECAVLGGLMLGGDLAVSRLSLINISEPTRPY